MFLPMEISIIIIVWHVKAGYEVLIPFQHFLPQSLLTIRLWWIPILWYQWEKPEEYAIYEEELDDLEEQQHHLHESNLQPLSSLEVSEAQKVAAPTWAHEEDVKMLDHG